MEHSSKPDLNAALPLALDQLSADTRRVYLAFSAGLDSMVLLHSLLQSRQRYQIILWHINHGLQPNADAMEAFARRQAEIYQLGIRVDRLQLNAGASNLEAQARRQRYALFAAALQPEDALLTAHHAADQAETLLLNLLRGSGPAGLRAIATHDSLGQGVLIRPMLHLNRTELEEYARSHELGWVDDPSNASLRFDRNFIRHRIMPALLQRWPSAVEQLHRSSSWMQESQQLLDDLARLDYQALHRSLPCSTGECLACDPAAELSEARRKNVIRYWLRRHGRQVLGFRRMQQLLQQVWNSESPAARINGEAYSIRLYRKHLYLVDEPDPTIELNASYSLTTDCDLHIAQIGFLQSRESVLDRFHVVDRGQAAELRFRQQSGGDPAFRHRLKRLFHKHQVPPWMRDRVPQVYSGGELIGLWLF